MIAISDLRFAYPKGGFSLAIDGLRVAAGQHLAIAGPSGSGKTTVLNLIAGIVVPQSGKVVVDGTDLAALSDVDRRGFRARRIGFVLQNFGLIEYLTAEQNVLIATRINPALAPSAALRTRARELLSAVGLGDKCGHRPAALSTGEQQRVAIARALLTRPSILLADEATGNLDPDNKHRILDLMFTQARAVGTTVVAVTHDVELLSRFDRVVDFRDLQVAG